MVSQPPGADAGIVKAIQVNIMAGDALVPYVSRPLAAMVWTMSN